MKEIQNNRFVSVVELLDANTQSTSIDLSIVPFQPDEMVVRQIGFKCTGNAAAQDTVQVICDFTSSPLANFCVSNVADEVVNVSLDNRIKLHGASIQGQHIFSFPDIFLNGDIVDGTFVMLLEFIKYKN